MIRIFVGYDPREAAAYHTFCQSVLENATEPLSFTPLADNTLLDYTFCDQHEDGSNAFTYSRFLVPALCQYEGWAIFCDGDMLCLDDIAELWRLRDTRYAVQVVKHDYKTKHPVKYMGAKNEDYPRKNWSSVVLWNCGHPANRILTADRVARQTGAWLHRFEWLDDDQIGALPIWWNWLVTEYNYNPDICLAHFTLGIPAFDGCEGCDHSREWFKAVERAMYVKND